MSVGFRATFQTANVNFSMKKRLVVGSLLDLYQPLTLIACAATILYHSPAWLVSVMSKTAIKTSNFENRLRCYRFDD